MAAASVEIKGLEEVKTYLSQFPDESFQGAKKVFQKAVLGAANKVKQFDKLKTRTGALKRSIQQSVSGTNLRDLQASIFSAQGSGADEVKYAPIQEFGGVVRAIDKYARVPGGPYLNIPIADNKTPAGVMRESAREVFKSGEGYIRKAKSGKWFVFKGDKLMFVLVKSVTLKERLGMMDAAEVEIPTLLQGLREVIGEEA